jgi:hypothetical protein
VATDNPAGVPIIGPSTPYVTPALLRAATTGITWSTIPNRNATAAQQLDEQMNICVRASAMLEANANQVLRAALNVETFVGPGGFRCQVNNSTGVARLLTSATPVTGIVSGRSSPTAAFPPQWQTIAADQFRPENPISGVAPSAAGDGGQAILLAPGFVSWWWGRQATMVEVTFTSGWPHTSLTAEAAAGATSLTVSDITGWAAGAGGNVYDVGGFQEFVTVSAVTPTTTGASSGPGTLTVSTTAFPHDPGVLVTTMPEGLMQAAIYLAVAQALTRGATATVVQSTSGGAAGGGPQSADQLMKLAYELTRSYGRFL